MKKIPVIAAAVLLAASAAQAQNMDDLLNKAKGKVKQATDKTAGQSKSSTENSQAKQGNTMEEASKEALSGPPSELTIENQQAYARAMMADRRPVAAEKNDASPNYHYRRLTQTAKMPIKFTWDDAAVKAATAKEKPMWEYINTICYEIMYGIAGEQGSYLKSALHKVKEIHLTRKRDPLNFTEIGYSFNASTGVLTAALNMNEGEEGSGPSSSSSIAHWITKNMTTAGKSSVEKANEAGYRNAANSTSHGTTPLASTGPKASSTKSWTCTWCHQEVTAASRPSLAGCPRNSAGQHAWHN